jgi:hypothetical protein
MMAKQILTHNKKKAVKELLTEVKRETNKVNRAKRIHAADRWSPAC